MFQEDDVIVNDTIMEKISQLNLIRREFLKVNVRLDSSLTHKETDMALVSKEEFIGSLGGILNIWIGITFITLVICTLIYQKIPIMTRV